MKSPLKALFLAQFLSAFVDNMILFLALGILQRDQYPDYYLPFVQSTFLAAYIIFSPWVGRFADKHPKSKVLIIGNAVKALGICLLFFGINPALSYGVVGIGAVIYSPAKYGILPWLTKGDDALLDANAKLESYTILAILLGSVAGGIFADVSIVLGLVISFLLYMASIAVNTAIPNDAGNPGITYENAIKRFISDTRELFVRPVSRFALIGCGSFWFSTSVLRIIILAWIPVTLAIVSNTQVSLIVATTGVGIVVGALLTPKILSVSTIHRTIVLGAALVACIISFIFIQDLYVTIFMLLFVGMFGGIYIVPMNTVLQEVGHQSIGAGKTIAVQNFVENIFMFVGMGAFTMAMQQKIGLGTSIFVVGMTLLAMVIYLATLRKKQADAFKKRHDNIF